MKIRSITSFVTASPDGTIGELDVAAQTSALGQEVFASAGFEVQTQRLATQPFSTYFPQEVSVAVALAQQMNTLVEQAGFSYLSLGPALPVHPWAFVFIPHILAISSKVFCTGIIADLKNGISLPAVKACGNIITRLTPMTSDGFTNLRFAALANVPAHGPFFPAAYHDGSKPGFSLAMECADVVLECIQNAGNITEATHTLVNRFEDTAAKLEKLCAVITKTTGMRFLGFDFSPAPFPEDGCSLAGAMEALGVQIGKHGGVAAAAILASALDKGNWKKAGFNGMMLPVLEDSVLAQRTENASFSIKDLLLYSTVCGTGLDTVPLPGSATPEQLAAILMDIAAIALRLDKPLTARLMPIPNKKAGDMTGFDFAFFANGRVMELDAKPLEALLSRDEVLSISPRHQR